MASKRFKSQVCAYCAARSSCTEDHVFARAFFLEKHRANLPKAPACRQCNAEKSKLEHYLATVLPFGGRHFDALEALVSKVPRRLRKNQRLHREISDGKTEIELIEDSASSLALAVPVDGNAIERVFVFIVKGLAWHHWRVYLAGGVHVVAQSLTADGCDFFEENFFSLKAAQRVAVNLGAGTFVYEGVQAVDTPTVTAWRFRVYGGALFVGDDDLASSEIGVLSGPRQVMQGEV
jgi:hypothetical protein